MAPRILISDLIAQEGVDLLNRHAQVDLRPGLSKEELKRILPDYDGLIVRTETIVSADVIDAGTRLQVIGRAGVGVDNIDLDAATQQGIAVVNAPIGNIVAAAEHTMALMLALARHIPQANATLREGTWKRSSFIGVELRNKTLGIVGLGRVGSEVARRAAGFNMRLLGYDPFVAHDYAWNLRVELTSLEELCRRSDFITVHAPLNDATRGLIGRRELGMIRPHVRLVNAARGGLVDEEALLEALDDGRLAGAGFDVFTQEPLKEWKLVKHPKVISTPHLGGSTAEAQQEVAREVAKEVLSILDGQPARSMVNLPFVPVDVQAAVDPYLETTTVLGRLAVQLVEGEILSLDVWYPVYWRAGQPRRLHAQSKGAVGHPLAQIRGPMSQERLNLVNTGAIAAQQGMHITEGRDATPGPYAFMATVEAKTDRDKVVLGGRLSQNEMHILRVNDYMLDVVPSSPYILFIHHNDRPGMIGMVGSITGQHDVNISFMEVGRLKARGPAMMMLGLDDPMPEEVLEKIRAIPHIYSAKVVRL